MSFQDLPRELLNIISEDLSAKDLFHLCNISSRFREFCPSLAQAWFQVHGFGRVNNPVLWLQRWDGCREQIISPSVSQSIPFQRYFYTTFPEDRNRWNIFVNCLSQSLRENEVSIAEALIREFWSQVGGLDGILYLLAFFGQGDLIGKLLSDPTLPLLGRLVTPGLIDPQSRTQVSPGLLAPLHRMISTLNLPNFESLFLGALDGNQAGIIKRLLEEWLPNYYQGFIPLEEMLSLAAEDGSGAVLDELLNQGASNYPEAVERAAEKGRIESVIHLMRRASNVPTSDLVELGRLVPNLIEVARQGAISGNQLEFLRLLDPQLPPLTEATLYHAQSEGSPEILQLLNSRGYTVG